MKKIVVASMTLAAALAGAVFIGPVWTQGQTAQTLPYTDPVRVAEGAALYGTYCASCHGADLEGEPDWQSRDADGYLPAPPHDATGHTWHHDTALLTRIVRDGTEAIVGGTYRSNMIGFGDVMTDNEIVSVLAYIKSTWPAEVQDIHTEIDARAFP